MTNSSPERTIRTAIEKLSGTFLKDFVSFMYGTVSAVNNTTETCTVINSTGEAEVEMPNVKLQAGVGDGITARPAVGSEVIVAYSKYVEPFLISTSDILNMFLVASGTITLNDGTFGGLVKVIDLTAKLNNLENDINDLKQVFSGWTPVPNDGGAALKTAATTWYGSNLTPTVQADIENTKIIHGT